MRRGETICFYRARGGEKTVYITMLYHKNKLRGSIVENNRSQHITTHTKKANVI